MAPLERLARAVLLFHRGGRWTGTDRNEWAMLTNEEDATTVVLCDLARRLLAKGQGDHTMSAYDPQCLLLAEYFLANVVPVEGDQKRLADKLAQHIEDAIDAWVRQVRADEPGDTA